VTKKPRVLVVEDDLSMGNAYQDYFEHVDYELTLTRSATEARVEFAADTRRNHAK